MSFRDDRDAMRARLEATEAELDRVRRELAEARGELPQRPVPSCASTSGVWRGVVMTGLLGVVLSGVCVGALQTRRHEGFASVHRTGRVAQVGGVEGLRAGDTCDVRVLPNATGEYNCRILLRCGERLLYGEGHYGYTRCAVAGGVPVSAQDARTTSEEGDGALTLDLRAGTLHFWDDAPRNVSLDVTLDAPLAR